VIHPQAPEKPAEQPDKARRVAVIRAVTILMAVLVGLMVAFFWGHSFIWLLRDLHHKIRRRGQ
jgi:cell division septal protein FtsQ